jgi:hypothetical protein
MYESDPNSKTLSPSSHPSRKMTEDENVGGLLIEGESYSLYGKRERVERDYDDVSKYHTIMYRS